LKQILNGIPGWGAIFFAKIRDISIKSTKQFEPGVIAIWEQFF